LSGPSGSTVDVEFLPVSLSGPSRSAVDVGFLPVSLSGPSGSAVDVGFLPVSMSGPSRSAVDVGFLPVSLSGPSESTVDVTKSIEAGGICGAAEHLSARRLLPEPPTSYPSVSAVRVDGGRRAKCDGSTA